MRRAARAREDQCDRAAVHSHARDNVARQHLRNHSCRRQHHGGHTDIPALPRCHRVLTSEKPRERGYPKEPRTLGEHLKRRRLDLGLRQRDVAAELGVTEQTVRHWESGKHPPPVRRVPGIQAFLGFCPYDPAWTFGRRLRAAREAQGLSRRHAAALVGVDEGTIARAERDVPGMARRSLMALAGLHNLWTGFRAEPLPAHSAKRRDQPQMLATSGAASLRTGVARRPRNP